MKFLIDKSPAGLQAKMLRHPELIAGQLLTPLTRYANAGRVFAIDNGAFSRFDASGFARLLERDCQRRDDCLFVAVPDVVGNARRTLEIFQRRHLFVKGWRVALVAQDGMEDFEVPWSEIDCLFIGGRDPWKDSQASMDLVKTAKVLGKHVHIGRVNEIKRYRRFSELGADTCDGSGVAMYDHMLDDIALALSGQQPPTLFDGEKDVSNSHVQDSCEVPL